MTPFLTDALDFLGVQRSADESWTMATKLFSSIGSEGITFGCLRRGRSGPPDVFTDANPDLVADYMLECPHRVVQFGC